MTKRADDPSPWGEDFEWTQLPARAPRRDDKIPVPDSGRDEPTEPAIEPMTAAREARSFADPASGPSQRASRPPHRRAKAERRWIAVASIFVLGFALGGLVGYLSRGDGRPSNQTTVDVSLDQVTVTETR